MPGTRARNSLDNIGPYRAGVSACVAVTKLVVAAMRAPVPAHAGIGQVAEASNTLSNLRTTDRCGVILTPPNGVADVKIRLSGDLGRTLSAIKFSGDGPRNQRADLVCQ